MAHRSDPRLLALHGLRLRGLAEPADLADYMDADRDAVAAQLDAAEAEGLVTLRHGRMAGYQLSPDGRAEGERLVAAELDAAGARDAVASVYDDFGPLNTAVLDVCTRWQLRGQDATAVVNDHTDPDHDAAVLADLFAVHDRAQPVLDTLSARLERFGPHGVRLGTALDHVLAGDHDWLTRPMFPSYHSSWFELHEDLLVTLGRERHPEGRSA